MDLEADGQCSDVEQSPFSSSPELSGSARRWLVVIVAAASLLAGCVSAVSVKGQNRVEMAVCEECEEEEYFDQPYWQSFIMFCGEALCLVVWWIEIWWRNRKGRRLMYIEFPSNEASFNKPRTPVWWWMLPALMDLLSTSFQNMAYSMTYASTVLVLGNTSLIFTGILSIILMRRPLRLYEWVGILTMTIAMGVASVRAIVSPESETNTDADRAWLGIILTLLSAISGAWQVTLEEWFYKRRYFPPMGSLGLQGLFGIIMSVVAMVITNATGTYTFSIGWYQMNNSKIIMAGNLSHIFSSLLCNGAGICTTKLGSAMLRAVVWALRSPVVWVIELGLGWQDYAWEQLVALILSGIGFCIYLFIVPLSQGRTPTLYACLQRQVPCCCIKSSEAAAAAAEEDGAPPIAHSQSFQPQKTM